MRMLVLGRGLARLGPVPTISCRSDVTEVRVADLHVDHLPEFLAPYPEAIDPDAARRPRR